MKSFGTLISGILLSTPLFASTIPQKSDSFTFTDAAFLPGISYGVGLNPSWNWTVRATPHFRIHYRSESTGAIIDRVSQYFEDAHTLMVEPLHWEPKKPINVLLLDNTDAANGAAAATLDFGVIIYATPPENHTSISHYDDWLKLVIYHEYAHILNMDPTRGVWRILRWLTGPVTLPNSLWPRWMLEGLAVVVETRFSSLGRGRSPYWEAILRSAVAENKLRDREFISLDRVTGPNPEFPDGETPYLFGYHLMNQLVMSHHQRYSDADLDPLHALGSLSERSSKRIPYLLNWHLEPEGPTSWDTLWEKFLSSTEYSARQQIQKIQTQEVTQLKNLTPEVPDARGTVLSRDGQFLAYSADPDDRRASVYVLDRIHQKKYRIRDRILGATSAFLGKNRTGKYTHLLYSAAEVQDTFETYNDLLITPIQEDGEITSQWLTQGLRVRDPDVNPAEDYIVFVKTEKLGSHLYGAPLLFDEEHSKWKLGTLEPLLDSGPSGVISQPRFSPDGKKIVLSIHKAGQGSEEILEADLDSLRSPDPEVRSKAAQPIVSDGSFNRFPSYTPEGAVLYASNRSGVDNVYLLPAHRKAPTQTLSNVITGLSFPNLTPDGTIIASEVRWKGTTVVEFSPLTNRVSTAPTETAPDIRTLFHPIPQGQPAPTILTESQVPHPADDSYSFQNSLGPRAWYPTLGFSSDGYSAFGAGFLGYDAVDRHRYWLSGVTGKYLGKSYLDYNFQYDHLFDRSIIGIQISSTTTGAAVEADSTLSAQARNREFGLALSRPYVWTYSSFTPTLEVGVSNVIYADERDNFSTWTSPRWESPYVLLQANYFTGESTRWSITTERGHSLTAGLFGIPDGDSSALKGALSGTSYYSLGEHRVLVASARAAYAVLKSYETDGIYSIGYDGNRSSTRSTPHHQSAPSLLNQLVIRGYPQAYFVSDLALAADLEVRIPLVRLFRGLGVLPAYSQNLSGFAFIENTSVYSNTLEGSSLFAESTHLPSAGAGLKLTGTLFYNIPINAALEIQYGFNRTAGGGRTLVAALNSSLPF